MENQQEKKTSDPEPKVRDRKFLKGFLLGIAATLLIGFGARQAQLYTLSHEKAGDEQTKDSVLTQANLNKLYTLQELIGQNYNGELDWDQLADGMCMGLVAGVGDKYSRYYTKDQYQAETEENSGHFKGIGIIIGINEDGYPYVAKCYQGAPAQKAGIRDKDILYKVNGEVVTELGTSGIKKLIQNSKDETAVISVVREGESEPLEYTMKLEDVQTPMVEHEMLADNIGYIVIYEFTETCADQFQKALDELRQQGAKGLVVDLRDNPGGSYQGVCKLLDGILPEGVIVSTVDKQGNEKEEMSEGKTPLQLPLAVLVDGGSASASEIFAGAVQDYGIGTVVGTQTYGKGCVQQLWSLKDGSGVKITTADYYTPKGTNINGVGITPDVKVELDESLEKLTTVPKEQDNQLQKALEVVKKG